MKFLVSALLLLVIILGWFLNVEITSNREQRDQIQKITASRAEKSKRDAFELQAKCAQQATKTFRELGYNPSSDQLQNHYNQKLNRCFMAVSTQFGSFKYLFDAYEEREYAEFNRVFIKGGNPIIVCSLMPLGAELKSCNSDREYSAFIEQYLN
ncbi:hypothetical protein [Sulfuriferula nivalis]|uniref:Uncharacterized protein n=1 Tax=Sulfuriferula nivalis TaxID=2675298 RepID=A0A809SIJ1_9PROT|nr:hypothetical protein [Sulfuriferula nivalis]BBP01980.1 hypothetical protein SFSGTM_26880 [Sulfuriferula nivalis]